MQFSNFGHKYLGDCGILQLMDDLGKAVQRDDVIMLGGGMLWLNTRARRAMNQGEAYGEHPEEAVDRVELDVDIRQELCTCSTACRTR